MPHRQSFRSSFTGLASSLVILALVTSSVLADDATLNWANGDSLSGELVSANEKSLIWRSPMFAEPLEIELAALSLVKYPQVETEGTPNPDRFRILVRNGDLLAGNLVGLTGSTLTFTSSRFGTFEIARDQVLSLQQAANEGGLIFTGPRGLDGWQPAFRRPANVNQMPGMPMLRAARIGGVAAVEPTPNTPTSWTEGLDGSLQSARPGAALFLPLELPERFEVELLIETATTFAFAMAVGRDARDGLRVETWVDELVAANGTAFTSLKSLTDTERVLHLHAFVDYRAGTMSVYSRSGEKLGEVATTGLRSGAEGLLFRNGDYDLKIQRLQVSRWDGREPQLATGQGMRIRTTDGTSRTGRVTGFDPTVQMLQFDSDGATTAIALTDVDSLLMTTQAAGPPAPRGTCQVVGQDGSLVSGDMERIADGTVLIKTAHCAAPLTIPLEHVQRIGLSGRPDAKVADESHDRMFHRHGSLAGRLIVDGQSDRPVQWIPVGGVNAVPLKAGDDARFLRTSGIRHLSEEPDLQKEFPDVVCLTSGDVLPCRLESVRDGHVQLTSPFTDVRQVPMAAVQAVELAAASRTHQQGFADDRWKGNRRVKADATDKITLNGARTISHPDILTGDTVRFRLKWPDESYGNVTVRMFGDSKAKPPTSTTIAFSLSPNQVQVLDREPANDQQFGFRGGFGNTPAEGTVRVTESQANIEITVRDGALQVFVEEQLANTIPLVATGVTSRSIEFSATLAVSSVPAGGVEVSHFEVDNRSGASIRQFINQETREAAMKVPRFRRDNPQTHVLLAPNGDVLRGKLIEITGTHVVFESRLETLRFDRDRVAAVVWLKPPVQDATANSSATAEDAGDPEEGFVVTDQDGQAPMLAQLSDGFRIALSPERLADGRIHGRSSVLGSCSFPAATIRELFVGDPEGRASQAAWDQWTAQLAREPDWDVPAAAGGNSEGAALIGKAAPDFELPLLEGEMFRLSQHKGRIVVLDFWATWCGPCVAAMPDYLAAVSAIDPEKVIFVGVNQQEASDRIREFLAEQNLAPTVALDRSGEVAASFAVSGIPHLVIVGPDGIVEDVRVGFQSGSGEHLQESLQQMLDGSWKRPEPAAAKPAEPENVPAI